MSVRIQVAADAAQVVSAFDQINRAIRKTGQEGLRFEDLDFNHPELRELEADLRRVQQRFQDLEKVARSPTGAAVRNMNIGADPGMWFKEQNRYFPDQGALTSHTATVGRYIFDGTRFAPQDAPPPGPAPSGGNGGSGRRRPMVPRDDDGDDSGGGGDDGAAGGGGRDGGYGRRSVRAVANAGRQTLGGLLGFAGLQGIAGTISHALTQSSDEAAGADTLFRQMALGAQDFDMLRQSVRKASDGLGITYVQTERLAGMWSHLTNQAGYALVTDGVRASAGAARGFGMDPGLFVKAVGAAAAASADRDLRGGQAFDPKQFLMLAASTALSSGQSAQMDDVLQMLSGVVQTQSRLLIDHDNVGAFSSAYAGLVGANPALRGAGGMDLLNTVDSSIRRGGAMGMASQVFSWRSLDAAGIHGPWGQEWQNQGGAFEKIPGTNKTTLQAQIDEWKREYGPRSGNAFGHETEADKRAYLALGNQLGTSGRQAEALARMDGANTDALGAMLKRLGIDPKTMDETALNDIMKVSALGSSRQLGAYGAQMLKRTDLTAEERARIGGETDPEKLRGELMEALAKHGMPATDSSKIVDAATKLENSLTELGQGLTPAMLMLKDAVVGMVDVSGVLVNTISDSVGASAGGDGAALAKKRLAGDVSGIGGVGKRMWAAINGDDGKPHGDSVDSPLRDSFLASLADTESSGGKNMGYAGGAYGPYQFMPKTWLSQLAGAAHAGDPYVKNYLAGAGIEGMDDTDRLLMLRLRPDLAAHMAQRYEASDIIPAMTSAHVPISNLAMYAGWHYGAGPKHSGVSIMLAPDSAMMADIVGAKAAAANKDELARYPTVGAWKEHFGHKFNPESYDHTALPAGMDANSAASGGLAAGQAVPLVLGGNLQIDVNDKATGRKISTHQVPLTAVHAPRPGNAPVTPTAAPPPPDTSRAYHSMLADLGRGQAPGGPSMTPGGY